MVTVDSGKCRCGFGWGVFFTSTSADFQEIVWEVKMQSSACKSDLWEEPWAKGRCQSCPAGLAWCKPLLPQGVTLVLFGETIYAKQDISFLDKQPSNEIFRDLHISLWMLNRDATQFPFYVLKKTNKTEKQKWFENYLFMNLKLSSPWGVCQLSDWLI